MPLFFLTSPFLISLYSPSLTLISSTFTLSFFSNFFLLYFPLLASTSKLFFTCNPSPGINSPSLPTLSYNSYVFSLTISSPTFPPTLTLTFSTPSYFPRIPLILPIFHIYLISPALRASHPLIFTHSPLLISLYFP